MTAIGAVSEVRPNVLTDGALLAGRHLLMMRRRPASIAGAVIFPVIFTLLFFTLFDRVMERIGIDYVQHLLPAIVVQAMFFTGMSSAVIAAEELDGGMMTRLRSLPVSRSAPIVGLVAAGIARAVVSLAALIPLGYLLGFRFEVGVVSALGFVLVAVLLVATLCTGYIALGLTAKRPEAAQAVAALPYFPLFLLSSALTPADRFPNWLQPVVQHQPVSRACEALRSLATEGYDVGRTVGLAALWLVPMLIVFSALAVRALETDR